MDSLERPDFFAGRRFQNNDRVGVAVVAFAETAVEVDCGGAGGDVDDAAGGVGCDDGPGVAASGARMLEMFPVVPLTAGQAVSIGLTSYDGGVYFGLNADRDTMQDVEVLGSLIEESLAELVTATRGGRRR